MTKEQEVKKFMELFKISREEAEQLWEDDQNDFIGEEGEEMTKKAKEIKRYERGDKPKEKKKREVKLDEDKVKIISFLERILTDSDALEVFVKNPQKEITFRYNGGEYSLSLIKHRPPKK